MFKKIARRILKNEIDKLKQEHEIQSKEYLDTINEHAKKEHELTRQIELLKGESKTNEEVLNKLKQENEIMRKYYRLDSEPTDEEKIKIRIDLRTHELEMQLIKERMESLEYAHTFMLLNATPYYPGVFGPWGYR